MQKSADQMPKGIVLVICMSAFLAPFMGSAYNLALPDIGAAFSLNAVELTWFNTGYLLPTAILQFPFAKMADSFGRRKFFIIGLMGIGFSCLVAPLVPNGTALIVMRVLTGTFSAMMFVTSMTILMANVPPAGRAKALAFNTTTVYLALAIGPVAGGVLTHYLGWQSIFYISGALALSTAFMGFKLVHKEVPAAREGSFDFIGSIVYGLALTCMIYGMTVLPSVKGLILICTGIVGFVAFVLYEKIPASPVINIKLFTENRVFSLGCLAALINYSASSAGGFMLSLYLQYIKGFGASLAGLVLISQALIQSASSLSTGRLSERFNPANLATLGMGITSAGLFGMIFVGPGTPVWVLIIFLLFMGCGFGLFSSPNTNVIMSSVDKKYYGQASAATGTARLTGQSFSMGIAAMAIALFMGTNKITPELYPQFMRSMRMTFTIFTALCVLGVFASAVKTKYRK